jgi:hypothetical protein
MQNFRRQRSGTARRERGGENWCRPYGTRSRAHFQALTAWAIPFRRFADGFCHYRSLLQRVRRVMLSAAMNIGLRAGGRGCRSARRERRRRRFRRARWVLYDS